MSALRPAAWATAGLLGAALLASLPALAQRGAPAGGRGPGPFAGSYRLTRDVSVELTAPWPMRHAETTQVSVTVRPAADADMVFMLHARDSNCQLSANRTGATSIAFPSGQSCSQSAMGRGTITGTLITGTGQLQGRRLTLDLTWTLSGTLMSARVSGSGVDRVVGQRR